MYFYRIYLVDRSGRVSLIEDRSGTRELLSISIARGGWTSSIVGDLLVEAFKSLPDRLVCVERGRLAIEGVSPKTADILEWPSRFLLPNLDCAGADEVLCLMTWARARAMPVHSVAEFCRNRGLARVTFDHRRRRALEKIAWELNGDATTL
ncbi:MAG: hypothetical protein JO324_08200 [Candidatus Eremiobacteraeota bacterium]|nr:hypothetical protein [Candidatus Eremiobacteraeota bacterium]